MTYSIVARSIDGLTLGIGVISGSYNVGARVPWIKKGTGVVATQAYTNPYLGRYILTYLSSGLSAVDAMMRALMKDAGRDFRQLAVITPSGDKAYYTGKNVPKPYGEALSENCICIGNLLSSKDVVDEMLRAFLDNEHDIILAIIRALEAGHEIGGDARGDLSGAIIIVGEDPRLQKVGEEIRLFVKAEGNPAFTLKRMLIKKFHIETI